MRLDAGVEHVERIAVAELVEELEIGALIQAKALELHFSMTSVDRTVTIEGDPQIIAGAIANLLQNAFKFTRKNGNVSLTTHATADRVLFEVEDECGGLPPGRAEELFRAYEQRGDEREDRASLVELLGSGRCGSRGHDAEGSRDPMMPDPRLTSPSR